MSAAVVPPLSVLDAARAFAARGWRPFPVEYGGKRPAVGINWGTATASAASDGTLELWFGREPVNVGVAARGSGLVILDDDTGDGMQRLCEAYAQPIPVTYRVRTAKGWHWYFDAPQHVDIGNAPGMLADFGFDVRGGKGGAKEAGGYVVAAGSVHGGGHVYAAEDPDADTTELPWWLVELLLPAPEHAEPDAEHAEPDRERRYTHDQAIEWVQLYAVGPLTAATEGGRNTALNTAAIVAGHFVPAFWSEQWATSRLSELAEQVGLDPSEIGPTVRSGMRAGMAQPYTLVERDPFASGSGASGEAADPFELAVEHELHRLQVLDEARRRLATARHAHRPSIADGVLDDLDAIESPAMLLGSLIPDQAVGFLAGRSGAYKSFLATSWACCIATGRPWLGRAEFAVSRPLRTLYVAAEGAAGAAGRIKAWETATGTSRRGRLLLYPRAIHLNDVAQVEELRAYVVEHEFAFLVIDTYHRSAPGTEENSSTDFGAVFEAVAMLRDEHGCATLFVDHTGAAKTGNPRGTSAKRDDADYVLSAGYQGEEAVADAQREVWVTKLKDTDTSGRWPIRLDEVEGEHFPVVGIGGVVRSSAGFGDDFGEWWQLDQLPEMPERVAQAIQSEASRDRGRGADAARWVWRYLAVVNDEQGLTSAQIGAALSAVPRAKPITRDAVKKALPLLDRAGIVGRDRTRIWLDESARPEAE